MKDNENKNIKSGIVLERNRSTVSTTIMANTEVSRQNKMMRTKKYESNTINRQISPHHSSSNTSKKSSSSSASKQKKKKIPSLLHRLTIVDVEASSSRKKKGRRKHDSSVPRNEKPLPEELLLRYGQQDSISMIPDCFSNINTFSKEEEMESNMAVNDHGPALFTFDLVPSLSEDLSCGKNGEGTEGEDVEDNDTTDANIGDDDDISGIFNELEENDAKCVKDVEENYFTNKKGTDTSITTDKNDTNMEILVALSKLELTSRTRTESTAFLSEVSSNDTSLQLLDNEPTRISGPSKFDKHLQDEASLVARDELQVKASRCISFNILSMFD